MTNAITQKYQDARALNEVAEELQHARFQHTPFASAHEGFCVILEEGTELFEHVCEKAHKRDLVKMRHEAIQVAAMAVKFASDLAPVDEP